MRAPLLALCLVAAYLLLRLPNLRDMPAFTDETTYARWAQLIAADPIHNNLVSMNDAKLPLHYWLLALARPLSSDPIYSGRLLSVLFGAATLLLLFPLAAELARAQRIKPRSAELFAVIAGILLITCPLLNVLQRMIMAESLLIFESILLAWLSLRLIRLVAEHATMRRLLLNGIFWGLAWAAALLTKQVFSYMLWSLLLFASIVHIRRDNWRHLLKRSVPPVITGTAIGLLFFVPMLLANDTYSLRIRLFYKPVFLAPLASNRWLGIWINFKTLFLPESLGQMQWWPHDPARPLEAGLLYIYLTPPILILVIIGIAVMAWQKRFRLLAFFGFWALLLIGALVATGSPILPRFLAAGIIPLLLAAAWALCEFFAMLTHHLRNRALPAAAGILAAAFLAWPALASAWTTSDWRAPTLPILDADQYLTSFGGGQATQDAIAWLEAQAREKPITVVTGNWVGTPNDMVWLSLSRSPNIQVYWHDTQKVSLRPLPGEGDSFLLGTGRWINSKRNPVATGTHDVYMLVPVIHKPGVFGFESFIPPSHLPNAQIVTSFRNYVPAGAPMSYQEILVMRIPKNPPQVTAASESGN